MDAQGDDLLPILLVPDPTLKTKARRVVDADKPLLSNLAAAMLRTMYAAPGIGLAAPQIGISLRLAVVDLATDGKKRPLVLVNPEIVEASAEQSVREEGCLSIPDIYADVVRPTQVSVRYHDLEGVRRMVDADGLFAACLQHEIDHLNGILFVDHLTSLKRNMLLRRLAKERRKKVTG